MALTGTLKDLSVVDLVQFPFRGKKTGELVVTGPRHTATFFYREGELIHAAMEKLEGFEVLVAVLDWPQGDFEFKAKDVARKTTISGDLHHVVMRALKERDERLEAERQRQREAAEKQDRRRSLGGGRDLQRLERELGQLVRSHSFMLYACLASGAGDLLAEASTGRSKPEGAAELIAKTIGFVRDYPRGKLERLISSDNLGTLTLEMLQGGEFLAVVTDKDAPLGAVVRQVSKFVEVIAD